VHLERVRKMTDGKDFKLGGNLYLDEITTTNFRHRQLPLRFRVGDVDGVYEFSPQQMTSPNRLRHIHAARRHRRSAPDAGRPKPFSDKRVRQAIVKSVDNAW